MSKLHKTRRVILGDRTSLHDSNLDRFLKETCTDQTLSSADPHDFPKEEYISRYRRTRELMLERGLDALMVTGDLTQCTNYRYLSGHLIRGGKNTNSARPNIIVLPAESDPVLIVWDWIRSEAETTSWVKDIETWTMPFSFKAVEHVLQYKGLADAKIGAELGLDTRMMMPFEEFDKLRRGLPRARFVDASDIIWKLRMKKSEAEIERLKKACEIHGRALAKLFDTVREGMTEASLTTKLFGYMIEEGADKTGRIGAVTIKTGKEWPDSIMYDRPERVLKKGDLVWVDGGSWFKGYMCDIARVGVLGEPSSSQKRRHDLVEKFAEMTINVIRPGMKASDITKAALDAFRSLKIDSTNVAFFSPPTLRHIAHGIGLETIEHPYMRMDNNMIIVPGMTLAIEITKLAMYHIEQNIVVTEDGCDLLSTEPSTQLHVCG